ncbi:MAG: hypothetical protein H0X41_00475 [Chitinophagaceae bacterium]|nr:hypothetical protein [Chitinophagaceae bacterium]
MSNYAGTTVVDQQGNPADGGLVFWKFNRLLNFQRAHRIADQEVAVPYLERPGFAVIRL